MLSVLLSLAVLVTRAEAPIMVSCLVLRGSTRFTRTFPASMSSHLSGPTMAVQETRADFINKHIIIISLKTTESQVWGTSLQSQRWSDFCELRPVWFQ